MATIADDGSGSEREREDSGTLVDKRQLDGRPVDRVRTHRSISTEAIAQRIIPFFIA